MSRKRVTSSIRHIIGKHAKKSTGRIAASTAFRASNYLLFGICAADIALTGGLASTALVAYGALGTVGFAGHALLNRPMTDTNTAGQKVYYASPLVRDALVAMEEKLAIAYDAIARTSCRQDRLSAQNTFLQMTREFGRDRDTLSGAFDIVGGAPDESYTLIVNKNGRVMLTMAAAALVVTASMAPPAPPPAQKPDMPSLPQPDSDSIEKMKRRMEALEKSARKKPPEGPAR